MKWIKPSGIEFETNDLPETIKYCKSLGFKEDKPVIEKSKPKKVKKDVNGD